MKDHERQFWAEFPYSGKNYTVGADLFGQGSWHIDETGYTLVDQNPDFYNYVGYVGDKEVPVTSDLAALADLIMTNIYWATQEED